MTQLHASGGFPRARLAAAVSATIACAYFSLGTGCGGGSIAGPETTLRLHFDRGQDRITLRAMVEGSRVLLQFDSELGVAAVGDTPVNGGTVGASWEGLSVERGQTAVWLVCDSEHYDAPDGGPSVWVLQGGSGCEFQLARDEAKEAWNTDLTLTPVQSVDCGGEAESFGVHIEQIDLP